MPERQCDQLPFGGQDMNEKVTTDALLKRLFKANDLEEFLKENEGEMQTADFCSVLAELTEEHGLTPARVIERSLIDRTYGYQLYSGKRKPSREKVLQLSIGLRLNMDETQTLLRAAGHSALYPRIRRDAVILYGIRKKMDVLEIQEYLQSFGLTLLGNAPYGDE